MKNEISSDTNDQPNAPDSASDEGKSNEVTVNGLKSPKPASSINNTDNHAPNEDGTVQSPASSLRGRKRKLSEVRSNKNKTVSPPWKAFAADGPTSFKAEDGRRKSGRRNAVPLELQPQGSRRQTRGEYRQYQGEKTKGSDTSHNNNNEGEHRRKSSRVSGQHQRWASSSITASPDQVRQGDPSHPKIDKQRSSKRTSTENTASPYPLRQSSRATVSTGQRRGFRKVSSRENLNHASDSGRVTSTPSNTSKHPRLSESPRIMLRLGPRSLPTLSPGNILLPRKFGSLEKFLTLDNPLEGEDEHRLNSSEASREAAIRLKLVEAGRPGGVLSSASLAFVEEDEEAEKEPFTGFAHLDYLNKHVEDLQQRILREARGHRSIAKRLAQAAAAAARAKMPKTAEELEAEAQAKTKENQKLVIKQYKSYLEFASHKVMQVKQEEYYAREAAAGREQMKEWVDRSEGLLNARTGHHLNEVQGMHSDEAGSASSASGDDDGSSDENDEDGDSDSSSDDQDDNSEEDSDQDLTVEQLRAKYAHIPAQPHESEDEVTSQLSQREKSTSLASQNNMELEDVDEERIAVGIALPPHESIPDLEEVDDLLMDDEEKDSDTSGTPTEDEESDDESGESSEEGSEEDESTNLFGFLPRQDIEALEGSQIPTKEEDEEVPEKLLNGEEPPCNDPASEQQDVFEQPPTPSKFETSTGSPKVRMDEDQVSSHKMEVEDDRMPREQPNSLATPKENHLPDLLSYAHEGPSTKIAVSHLIRGQLRPYQHAGFEWLAGMYENATNGILADEMGLGKTFQTIALLAYLATHYHAWGPHLIVVPTSVILNWEIEFKKFLPGFKVLSYYGNLHERQEKRKGWNDPDKWNVCITSYQLALSDQVVLKRRNWHYLILDEAHNIKNHKSQRWQTLLSFKSQARLLLTGTPLQNNLAELWSLLFFLAPEQDSEGKTSFGDLSEFSKVFHRPVDQILEHGRGALDEEAMSIVSKLHKVLRPHLLRRLKADVETQMPKKYEHVTVCRLSKRQRQLYDGYMGLAGTRESFASGNYMSIINCLMQLRKVCNHPDLFETRQIVTSWALPKCAIADYEVKELLVRRRLLGSITKTENLESCSLWRSNVSTFADLQARQLSAASQYSTVLDSAGDFSERTDSDASDVISALHSVGQSMRERQLSSVSSLRDRTLRRLSMKPVYSSGLLGRLRFVNMPQLLSRTPALNLPSSKNFLNKSSVLDDLVLDIDRRSGLLKPLVQRFGCTTPNVVAPSMSRFALTREGVDVIRHSLNLDSHDPFHEARVRLSIAFPDKSLIQYDCGKLQQLDKLLRNLQAGGHRAVIFTQMTKVLDILEQFMNLHGHRYLRLDGATKIEQRQIVTERFNSDTRILAFISSSRSGGLGINLTGADTVIFYDLDWNPAMDKQCQDRCHRIGQTRDVHIYRFVSEGTIEANILRKSNQKRMLDDVVIQEGDFTTEYFNRIGMVEDNEETDAAIDKVFGGGQTRMLQQAEDKEDQDAAKEAQKEDLQADDADFGDKGAERSSGAGTPHSATFAEKQQEPINGIRKEHCGQATVPTHERHERNPEDLDSSAREQLFDHFASNPLPQDKPIFTAVDEESHASPGGWDEYLIRLVSWELQDVVWAPPKSAKDKKKKKKGAEYGVIRR